MRIRGKKFRMAASTLAITSIACLCGTPVVAMKVYKKDGVSVSVDTTLTAATAYRASDINYENVGPANASAAGSDVSHKHDNSAQDNANLRWKKGKAYSEIFKGTVDTQIKYQDYGGLVRGRFWYDNALVEGNGGTRLPAYYPETPQQPSEPNQGIGKGGEILDAFVWGKWARNDIPFTLRAGNQVVNWGESTLFANGINTINPVDANALLTPGAEIKEALIPVKMLYGSANLTDLLSVEAFYQFEWEETRTPDCGTFFSTSDLVGEHCKAGFFASGQDWGSTFQPPIGGPIPAENLRLDRAGDITPDNGGEFGFAMRYYFEDIQTEAGLFFINYHSRLPIASGYAPDQEDIDMADTGLAFLNALQQRLQSAHYVLEYPEDIQLLGLSFNTSVDIGIPGGETAISGELSYRRNQPFQIEDSALITGLLGAPTQICPGDTDGDGDDDGQDTCLDKFNGNELISAYIRDQFYQTEITFVHFFDQILASDRWTVLLDLAYNYSNIPDKDQYLLNNTYNADQVSRWSDIPSTHPLYSRGKFESEYYPTRSAWGYRLRLSGEYSNVFAGINLVPAINFSHDVDGVTPGPIVNFLEDRKALGLSLEGNYSNTYKIEFVYTDFYGAEPYNQLNDRDFYSVSASVSF